MIKFKKIFCLAVVTLLITLSIIYIYPRKLNREFSGMMYRIGNSNYMENIKVIIDGYYSKGDKFEGTIIIGEKHLTKLNMRFDRFCGGFILYYDEAIGEYISYGNIFTRNKMNEFTICVLEENNTGSGGKTWSRGDGLMISVPAGSRDEAVTLSNSLMKEVLDKEEQIR